MGNILQKMGILENKMSKKIKVYLKEEFVREISRRNLSNIGLAEKIKISKTYLNSIMNGGLSVGPKTRNKIMQAFPGWEWNKIFYMIEGV